MQLFEQRILPGIWNVDDLINAAEDRMIVRTVPGKVFRVTPEIDSNSTLRAPERGCKTNMNPFVSETQTDTNGKTALLANFLVQGNLLEPNWKGPDHGTGLIRPFEAKCSVRSIVDNATASEPKWANRRSKLVSTEGDIAAEEVAQEQEGVTAEEADNDEARFADAYHKIQPSLQFGLDNCAWLMFARVLDCLDYKRSLRECREGSARCDHELHVATSSKP
jgi:hypothetical protein